MIEVPLEPIPMASPVIGPEEEQRVLEVLRSGRLSLGPVVPEFEQAFAATRRSRARNRGIERNRAGSIWRCARSG